MEHAGEKCVVHQELWSVTTSGNNVSKRNYGGQGGSFVESQRWEGDCNYNIEYNIEADSSRKELQNMKWCMEYSSWNS